VAAYRIASEALTNSLRHARATTCTVCLSVLEEGEPARLEIEVVDDGTGFRPVRRRGTGLRSMLERAEELGGTCVVEVRPEGGTRVVAQLPLAQGA
jgi:signal transduction histidine kinase